MKLDFLLTVVVRENDFIFNARKLVVSTRFGQPVRTTVSEPGCKSRTLLTVSESMNTERGA